MKNIKQYIKSLFPWKWIVIAVFVLTAQILVSLIVGRFSIIPSWWYVVNIVFWFFLGYFINLEKILDLIFEIEDVKSNQNKPYKVKGKIIWDSRSVAVVALIFMKYKNEDYVLINKRGKGTPDNQGLWNAPCGYLDWNESATEATYREVFEETGLNLADIINEKFILKTDLKQPFLVNSNPKDSNKQNVSLYHSLYFKSDDMPLLNTDNSEPDEVEDLKWCKVSELSNYEFAYNHDNRILDYYSMNKA